MTTSTTSEVINEIDNAAKAYSEARSELSTRVGILDDEIRTIQRRKIPGIKAALAAAANAQATVVALVDANQELFIKPRTMTLHGIKIGVQKGKGKIEWEDDEKILSAIRRTFAPATAERLIITTSKPAKDALAQLPAAELKKLGVIVAEAGDFVFVKAVDTAVDKLVARILKEGEIEEATP